MEGADSPAEIDVVAGARAMLRVAGARAMPRVAGAWAAPRVAGMRATLSAVRGEGSAELQGCHRVAVTVLQCFTVPP